VTIWYNIIKRFAAPSLPKPTQEYDQRYFDSLVNVLRLYFNQLDDLLGRIVAVTSSTVPVSIGGVNVDAFGRIRGSAPYTLFDSQNRYAKNDLFSESTTGSATVTYDANASTVQLNVTAASGDEVVRQTYRSFSYQPGKGLLVMNTFVMPTANSNQRIRIGYFNTENGVFLEREGTAIYLTRRTYVTGTAIDTRVAQADWNGDKLNGTGASGYTLDLTKAQIFWEDFEWLGVGSVRCGFVINGETIICHTFQNANNLTSVYMTTAILPVRYEITNFGASTAATLKQICSTVISEGGYEKKVATDVVRMTTPNTSIGSSFVPLMSIRLAPGRLGAVVIPDGYSVLPTSASSVTFEVAMYKNAYRRVQSLTNPFATTIGLPTVVVTDTAHGGATGDYVVFSGASTVGGLNLNNRYQITVTGVNTYTITASSNATSTVAAGGGAVSASYEFTESAWASTSSANVQQNLSATTMSGGTPVFSSYVVASTQSSAPIANGSDYNWDLQLGATLAGVSDTYTVAVRALTGTQTAIGTMSFWDLT